MSTRRILFAILVVALSVAAPAAQAHRRTPIPTTCFGLTATIDDHEGEIVGTPGDDVIIGDNGPNVIYGEGGTDHICSNGGHDVIGTPCCSDVDTLYADGGSGYDWIGTSNGGPNEIYGGSGNDSIDVSSFRSSASSDLLDGGPGDDFVGGDARSDTLRGGPGNDLLKGGLGDDQLYGDAGKDELYGEEGVDVLDGGTSKTMRKSHKARQDKDLCQVGPDGGTTTNCEREV